MSNRADAEFSLRNCRPRLDGNDASTNEWIRSYLLRGESPNEDLAAMLEAEKWYWTAPLKIDLSELEIITGPGKLYHEDEELWNSRVNRIVSTFEDVRDFPPALVIVEGTPTNPIFTVADGAHRVEAFRRRGLKILWALVGFANSEWKEKFLKEHHHNSKITKTLRKNSAMLKEQLHSHYVGDYAKRYDEIRIEQPHWHREHNAVERFVSIHNNATVLDAPIGTGRFLELYKKLGCNVVGLDISLDMLAVSAKKAAALGLEDIELVHGSLTQLATQEVDISVCVRFINLVSAEVAEKVVHSLAKISRKEVILHLTSVDTSHVNDRDKEAVKLHMAEAYLKQKREMHFTSHDHSEFMKWIAEAKLFIFDSIECQEPSGYARTFVYRLVKP